MNSPGSSENTDTLSRLTAALAEDERIARAAGERSAEWRSDGKGVEGGPFEPADPEWGILESGAHTVVYDEGWPLKPEALHIATFDPARVLRQAEALRKAIAEHRPGEGDDGIEYCATCSDCGPYNPHPVYADFPCPTVRALAGIYDTEPTDTEGAGS